MRLFQLALAIFLLGLMPGMAHAQLEGLRGLGIGAVMSTQPYVAIKDEARVDLIPAISYEQGRLWVAGKQAGVILTNPDGAGPWELSAILDYRFQGYEATDSLFLDGMDDREGTLEAGGLLTYDIGDGRLLMQARGDIGDTHGGFDILGQAELNWMVTKYTRISPYAGVLFRSADLADYYYGVRGDEALVSISVEGAPDARPEYDPGESLNPYVGIHVRQALNRHLVISAFARHDFLPTEITDSPIVDKEGQSSFGLVLAKPFTQ